MSEENENEWGIMCAGCRHIYVDKKSLPSSTCPVCGFHNAVHMGHERWRSRINADALGLQEWDLCPKCETVLPDNKICADCGHDERIGVGDLVNQPSHYTDGSIECIDAMVAAFGIESVRVWARINAFKYNWRGGKKDSEEQDIKKAIWYLRFSLGDDPRNDV